MLRLHGWLSISMLGRPSTAARRFAPAVSSAGRAGCGTMVRMMSLSETIACADPVLDVAQVVVMAKSLYRTGPAFRRKMQQLRPYTCPFDVLVSLVPENASVLDVGCGSGLFLGLAMLSGRCNTGVGVDISETAIRMAMAMRQDGLKPEQRARLTFQLVRSDNDWPSTTFDVVSLTDVLHHERPERRTALFDTAASRVRPGGILLYKDMCCRPLWRALLNWFQDLVVRHEWIRHCPVADIEAAARKAGFSELRAETINRLGYGHELRVFMRPTLLGTGR